MEDKELSITNVKNTLGWTYADVKWITEKDAALINQQRDDLLKSLKSKVNDSFLGSKLHVGELSPGCSTCGDGYWSCLFINGLCTKNCFFCPQDRKMREERTSLVEVPMESSKDYVAYLRKFNYKGVGFSGGEPFLVFDKLVTYIEEVRKEFGKSMYIWMYTNGDLATKDKLTRLKKAGLDEIRFNIAARKYDLTPVKLAAGIIDAVTVEIPMIPEDFELVKKLLIKMKKIGVKYLNIHQLVMAENNYKNYIRRGYTCMHTLPMAVVESEMAALRLLEYAADEKVGLPINYCTKMYKQEFQGMGLRARYADTVCMKFERITDAKYIRTLSVKDTLANIKKLTNLIKEKSRPELWTLNNTKTELFIDQSLLKYIDFDKHQLTITYFWPQLVNAANPAGEHGKEVRLNADRTVFIKKNFRVQEKLSKKVSVKAFERIFIKNEDWGQSIKSLFMKYKLKNDDDTKELNAEINQLFMLKEYERTPVGFPVMY